MHNIVAKTSIKSTQAPETRFTITVNFTNKGKTDAYMLSYNTPLEGLFSDCLEVLRDGKPVPYDGPIAKRSAPTKKEYVKIAAGKSVSMDVDVSTGYQVSVPGKYTVAYKGHVCDVCDKGDLKAKRLAERTMSPMTIPVKAHKFTVKPGRHGRATSGEAARRDEEVQLEAVSKKKTTKKAAVTPKPPIVVGGTTSRKSAARKAHKNGYAITVQALKDLKNDSHYKKWFGNHTASRFKAVKSVLTKTRDAMKTTQFTYNLTGTGCQSNWYAYTYMDTTTIWFCGEFWNAPATETDSKAGTVLHEHSHATASTDDIAYGQSSCKQLAKTTPASAIKNADSYAYFAGG